MLAAWAALRIPAARAAGEPTLHASWHEPYGAPRASATIEPSCADTLEADTLYLSFEVSRPVPLITAMNAQVYFRPVESDTLGDFWAFKTGTPNGGSLLIDFPPFEDQSVPLAWAQTGSYDVSYEKRSRVGRLDIKYYVAFDYALTIDPNVRYDFARIRFLHRRSTLPGCGQSVCLDWGNASLGFGTGREQPASGGTLSVARWNARPGADCSRARAPSGTKPWTPTKPGAR